MRSHYSHDNADIKKRGKIFPECYIQTACHYKVNFTKISDHFHSCSEYTVENQMTSEVVPCGISWQKLVFKELTILYFEIKLGVLLS